MSLMMRVTVFLSILMVLVTCVAGKSDGQCCTPVGCLYASYIIILGGRVPDDIQVCLPLCDLVIKHMTCI